MKEFMKIWAHNALCTCLIVLYIACFILPIVLVLYLYQETNSIPLLVTGVIIYAILAFSFLVTLYNKK